MDGVDTRGFSKTCHSRDEKRDRKPLKMIKYILILIGLRSVASVNTTTTQLQIPHVLFKPGTGYGHQAANFGVYPYGASLQQPVFYSESKFCNDADQQLTQYYPRAVDGMDQQIRDGHYHTPFILMIDRGDCAFTTKVRNAQKAGAAAVLIADDHCVCGHQECKIGDTYVCQRTLPIIVDDGSGRDISIPSFLLYKEDSDAIKQVLLQDQNVIFSMGFKIPAPDARVEYELWTAPTDHFIDENLWTSLRTIALALGDHASFTPQMSLYDGTQQDCTYDGNCPNMCTNNGRYCAFGLNDEKVSGADLVTESLRRICIWNRYGQEDGIGKEWFDYVYTFSSTCYKDGRLDRFTDEGCVTKAMKKSGIDPETINNCMRDSGGLEANAPNTLLDQALAAQQELGVVLIPSVWVNRVLVQGKMTFREIFSALCSGYVEGSQPQICHACQNCLHNPEKCIQDGGICENPSSGIAYSVFAGCLGGIVVVFVGMFVVYRTREKRHLRDQIRNIMVRGMGSSRIE
eukprot:scaffold2897_cov178-Amphora_coffeaeformis.AAC.23